MRLVVRQQENINIMNPHYTKLAKSVIELALSRSRAAEELHHPGLRGRAREIFVKDLLFPFLNPTFGVCTGIVVDSEGESSKQIDIIIFDKSLIPSLMLTGEEGIVPYESVLGTIEIKSKLSKPELVKAVDNARSVKNLTGKFQEVMPETPIKSSPICCIFAYSSTCSTASENNRLQEIVTKFNSENERPVYVPISGLCIGNSSFTKCINADQRPPVFETITVESALNFLVFLVDQVTILSRQRSKMVMSEYFFGE